MLHAPSVQSSISYKLVPLLTVLTGKSKGGWRVVPKIEKLPVSNSIMVSDMSPTPPTPGVGIPLNICI